MFNNILTIIPSRKGSKRLPHKNTLTVGGIPLAQRTIVTAKSAELKKIVVTTDYPEVKEIALKEDVAVIDRPEELATDEAKAEDVVLHAINYTEKNLNWNFDTICLLQVTSPLLKQETLKKALDDFINNKLSALISVNPSYQMTGGFYIVAKPEILQNKTLYPEGMGIYVTPWEESIDVDHLEDLRTAQAIDNYRIFQEIPLG